MTLQTNAALRGMTSKSLAKAIFDADLPEQFVRTIPAQSLYLVIKQNGLASSADVVDLISIEQTRTILDLDLWSKDQFNEENFWEWLALSDDSDPLKLTQKLLKSIDLKLIALLISRHVSVIIFDEATDNPPEIGYYTPDGGSTWISVKVQEKDRHFLFTRFLALVFETSSELFYQLLSIPNVSTESVLEEDSFQEKLKRLSGEGIPDAELTAKINYPLDRNSFSALLAGGEPYIPVSDIRIVEPLIYDRHSPLHPLVDLLGEIPAREELEGELTLIMNAAIINWGIEISDYEEVMSITEKVKGALNIGLQVAVDISGKSLRDIYAITGLQLLYRAGLTEIARVRRAAKKITEDNIRAIADDAALFSVVAHAKEPFPVLPLFVKQDGSVSEVEGRLLKGTRPFENLNDISVVLEYLARVPVQSN